MYSILLIEDDPEMCSLLADYLGNEGLALRICYTGSEGLAEALSGKYDLGILDVGLPDMNGFDILANIRAGSALPVIMLTGRVEDVDRIVGLEMGADDYLPKPFIPRELLARIRTILRRSRLAASTVPQRVRLLATEDLVLDRSSRQVECGGTLLNLTFAEFTMLEMLLEARGEIVLRETLSLKALGRELTAYDRSIDVHMSNLRKKLGPAADGGERIVTVRGAGYFYNTTVHAEDQLTGCSHPAGSGGVMSAPVRQAGALLQSEDNFIRETDIDGAPAVGEGAETASGNQQRGKQFLYGKADCDGSVAESKSCGSDAFAHSSLRGSGK